MIFVVLRFPNVDFFGGGLLAGPVGFHGQKERELDQAPTTVPSNALLHDPELVPRHIFLL